LTQS